MPTRKAELYERWLLWRGRKAPDIEVAELVEEAAPLVGAPVDVGEDEVYGCSEEEDAINADAEEEADNPEV